MPTLQARIRAARVGLGLSQLELAASGALPVHAVTRLEGGKDVRVSTLISVQNTLRAAGVDLIERDGRLGVIFSRQAIPTTGRKLRAVREALGLEQIELATLTGLADRTIRRLETDDPKLGQDARSAVEGAFETLGVDLSPAEGATGFLLPTEDRLSQRLARLRRSIANGVI